ncbi:MAG: glycosyltransferase, partial [Arenicellales bacterium]
GSEDRTKEIAAVFGGRVFDFEWRSDFAEARNFSLSKAKGEWILIMDADEKISPQDYEYFRKLVAKKPSGLMAYSIITRNYCNMANTIGWIPNSGQYISEEAGLGWLSSEKVRLFSNSSQIKFEGVVHEMVDPILKRLSVDIRKCHIAVHHYGRLDGGKLVRKDQAYYEIGRKKLLKNGGDIGTVRELAIQATVLERNSEAIELWQKFLSMEPGEAAVADAYVNMVSAYIRMHDYSNAHRLARKAVSLNPQMKEAQYNLGITELYRGNVEAAFNTLKKLRKSHPDFPPAQFLLVASNYCMNSKADVNRNINKLKKSAFGPALTYSVTELAEGLMAANQHQLAFNLLKSAMEDEIISKSMMTLYADCADKIKDSNGLCNIYSQQGDALSEAV